MPVSIVWDIKLTVLDRHIGNKSKSSSARAGNMLYVLVVVVRLVVVHVRYFMKILCNYKMVTL